MKSLFEVLYSREDHKMTLTDVPIPGEFLSLFENSPCNHWYVVDVTEDIVDVIFLDSSNRQERILYNNDPGLFCNFYVTNEKFTPDLSLRVLPGNDLRRKNS